MNWLGWLEGMAYKGSCLSPSVDVSHTSDRISKSWIPHLYYLSRTRISVMSVVFYFVDGTETVGGGVRNDYKAILFYEEYDNKKLPTVLPKYAERFTPSTKTWEGFMYGMCIQPIVHWFSKTAPLPCALPNKGSRHTKLRAELWAFQENRPGSLSIRYHELEDYKRRSLSGRGLRRGVPEALPYSGSIVEHGAL